MKKSWIFIFLLFTVSLTYAQTIEVTGGSKSTLSYPNIDGSGLDKVCVLYGLENAKITYQSSTGNTLKWYKYTTNIEDSLLVLSGINELTNLENNTGYIVQDGNSVKRVWIIDYKLYEATSLSVNEAASTDACNELHLTVNPQLFNMGYNEAKKGSIRRLIDLQIPLSYKSMEYSSSANAYISKNITFKIQNFSQSDILVSEAPLMNTVFTLGDDIFAQLWNLNKNILTLEYSAVKVQAKGVLTRIKRDADNEIIKGDKDEETSIVASGPIDIRFEGFANEPTASYFKWEIATDNTFQNVITTFTDKEFQYTFQENKDYYARFVTSNKLNSCTDSSDVFSIKLIESDIKVPRVFSPNGDGKNDVFYAEFKSIKTFHGWIFNRWGNELFSWSDPSKGWDGKVGGKYVTSGVYFYIIEAEGTDGHKHKLKGDINVFSAQQ